MASLLAFFGLAVSALIAVAPQPSAVEAASPVGVHGNKIVSDSAPVGWTPHVDDGYVQAIAEVGDWVIAGGNFSTVEDPDRTTQLTRNFIFAFEKGTGDISTTFVPQLNGEVRSIVPAGDGQSVFIGGGFNSVNGSTYRSVVKINVLTGAVDTQFDTPAFNGRVHELIFRNGLLYVAGRFTTIDGAAHPLVAALDPITAAVDPDVKIDISTPRPNRPGSTLAIGSADITPDGSRMAIIGNFTQIDGQERYQVAQLDLTTSPISLADWETDGYDDSCSGSFSSYMRDVEYSPDGSFFVIVTTGAFSGGYAVDTLCDTSARFETLATGSDLLPTWTNYTGGDTLLSAGIADEVVYQGGHERRVNNPYAADRPGRGSVWVEGMSAIDPRSGATLSWAPGRDRGVGVYTFEVTSDGLWVGSDTTRIARWNYRGRIALLPLDNDSEMPAEFTGTLTEATPEVFSLGAGNNENEMIVRQFDGDTVSGSSLVTTDPALGDTRGAFMSDGTLYTIVDDGGDRSLRTQTFDGTTFGPATEVDLRLLDGNNPDGTIRGANVNTAPGVNSNNQVRNNKPPNLPNFGNFDIPNANGMFYDPVTGRLYYTSPAYTWQKNGTRTSAPSLAYRQFSTESNIVGAKRIEPTDNLPGLDWTEVRSMFLDAAESELFIADVDGNLTRWGWDHWNATPIVGSDVVVSGPGVDGEDWSARSAFIFVGEGDSFPNDPPTAAATVTCDDALCTFDASTSTDTDGLILEYAWDFGDGTDIVVTTQSSVQHTYATSGSFNATVTVTDDDDAMDSVGVVANVVIPNVGPSAVLGASGSGLDFVFDGSGSSDSDGSVDVYAFDPGDGSGVVSGAADSLSHTYGAAGDYTVTLTVTDDDGAQDSTTVDVTAIDPTAIPVVEFGAIDSTNVNSSAPSVTVPVPGSVEVGDLLVLIGAFNSSTTVVTSPAGWTLLDSSLNSRASSQTFAWTKVAAPGDAGSSVTVPLSQFTKSSLQVASYTVDGGTPVVGDFAVEFDTSSTSVRTTPAVSVTTPGSVVISFWADKSGDNTSWAVPGTVDLRDLSVGSGGGRIVAAFADSGPVAPGPAGEQSATAAGAANRRGITWSIVIAPA